jgi:hypothetical protein
MKKKKEVIFLIDSNYFDMNLLGVTLEKYTKCKVFNFFSFEETLLYRNLNPKVIVHDNGQIQIKNFSDNVNFYNISNYMSMRPRLNHSEVVLALANQVSSMMY